MNDKEDSLTHALASFVLVVGNLSEGFRFVGPFSSFDEACVYADQIGSENWVATLEKPLEDD